MAYDVSFLKETWASETAKKFASRGEIAGFKEVMEVVVWHCRIGRVTWKMPKSVTYTYGGRDFRVWP